MTGRTKPIGSGVYAFAILLIFGIDAAMAAQPEAWEADWEKAVEAAKKEGQLTLYGSPDFEGLLASFTRSIQRSKSRAYLIAAPMWRSG